ncbi:MAG: hypothetical protein RLZZ68_1827 [Bacteroidota bacterium]
MQRKKVLITGAAGFLGSHLCDRFILEGFHVIAMDNLITGRMSNIEHLMPLEQFEFYRQDVSKFIHIPGELDYILHFASPASPIDYLKIPIQTLFRGTSLPWFGQRKRSKNSDCLYFRSLRRPRGSPSKRNVLG